MSSNVDQLILHSLKREHRQLKRLLHLMELNLDILQHGPSVRCKGNISSILEYLGRQITGPHCHKEKTIHHAVRNVRSSDPRFQSNINNEHRKIEALLKRAAGLLLEASENSDRDRLRALASLSTILYNHIQIEEKIRLPVARECLTQEDWQRVSRSVRKFTNEIEDAVDPAISEINAAREYRRIVISARPPPARG